MMLPTQSRLVSWGATGGGEGTGLPFPPVVSQPVTLYSIIRLVSGNLPISLFTASSSSYCLNEVRGREGKGQT